mmetsp:Transcript_28117/g.51392  ORF Transcript_28117/g.51392 Transcript_28117/m.51392 type:complete len:395 (+) Transcript_28117:81-1265(+)
MLFGRPSQAPASAPGATDQVERDLARAESDGYISRTGAGFGFAPSVSPREHHTWAIGMWKRMDRDNSGYITRQELDCEEFRNILKSVLVPKSTSTGGALYARAQTNQDQVVRFCMRKADLNNDGSLSFEEFKSVMLCLREETMEKHTANLIFAMFDLDGDMMISENEFKEIYRFYLGHNPTYDEFSEEWNRLNSKSTGYVSREQYIRWLQTSMNPVFVNHAPRESGAKFREGESTTTSASKKVSPSSVRQRTMMSKSASAMLNRPKWNQRFNNNAGADPNLVLPKGERRYFMNPQTPKELDRFYATHTGFNQHVRDYAAPDPVKRLRVVSTDTSDLMLAARHKPSGRMREYPASGSVVLWEDHWQTPLRFKSRSKPGDRPWAPHALFEASASPK